MRRSFIVCKKCGKKLLQRDKNGLFYFAYGMNPMNESMVSPPVEIIIHGSVKIKCYNRKCEHWNIVNFFPMREDFKQ